MSDETKTETAPTFQDVAKAAPDFDEDSLDSYCERVRATFSQFKDGLREKNEEVTPLGKLPKPPKYSGNDIPRVSTWRLWLKRVYASFVIVENDYEGKKYKMPMSDDGKEITFDPSKVVEVKEGWIAKHKGFGIEFYKPTWSPLVLGTVDK